MALFPGLVPPLVQIGLSIVETSPFHSQQPLSLFLAARHFASVPCRRVDGTAVVLQVVEQNVGKPSLREFALKCGPVTDVKKHLAGLTLSQLMACCNEVSRNCADPDTRHRANKLFIHLAGLTATTFLSNKQKEATEKAVREEVCRFLEKSVEFWT